LAVAFSEVDQTLGTDDRVICQFGDTGQEEDDPLTQLAALSDGLEPVVVFAAVLLEVCTQIEKWLPSQQHAGLSHVGDVITRARDNDQDAWNELVEHFSALLCSVARQYRLSDEDRADAVQSTWVRFVEHIDNIRAPDAIGGWLVTTCRRECLRILRRGARQLLVDVEDLDSGRELDPQRIVEDPADVVLRRGVQEVVREAIAGLPAPLRRVISGLLSEEANPGGSYASVSARLSIPVGSVGPLRQRAIAQLRRNANIASLGPPSEMLQ
jgi:RNA polymerase sigma factor (sigma-70 family)